MSLCQTDTLTWVQRSVSSRPVLDPVFVVPWIPCMCIIVVSTVSEQWLIAVSHRWISQLFMQRLAVFSRDIPHNEKDIVQRITKKIGINSFHSRWDQSHCMVENLSVYKWVSLCMVFQAVCGVNNWYSEVVCIVLGCTLFVALWEVRLKGWTLIFNLGICIRWDQSPI